MTFTGAGEVISRDSLFSDTPDFFFDRKRNKFCPGGRIVQERGERGTKRDKNKIQFFSPHVRYVW